MHQDRVLGNPRRQRAIHAPHRQAAALALRAVMNQLKDTERDERAAGLHNLRRPQRGLGLQQQRRIQTVIHLCRVLLIGNPVGDLVVLQPLSEQRDAVVHLVVHQNGNALAVRVFKTESQRYAGWRPRKIIRTPHALPFEPCLRFPGLKAGKSKGRRIGSHPVEPFGAQIGVVRLAEQTADIVWMAVQGDGGFGLDAAQQGRAVAGGGLQGDGRGNAGLHPELQFAMHRGAREDQRIAGIGAHR